MSLQWPPMRRTRMLPCACGGTVRADTIEPTAGVRAHQRSLRHRAWRERFEDEQRAALEQVSA